MSVLVTGAAGFIGSHVARALLTQGETVIGVDNFSGYYDPALEHARLNTLHGIRAFKFHQADITETTQDFGWTPHVTVEKGIPLFVNWFRAYVGSRQVELLDR